MNRTVLILGTLLGVGGALSNVPSILLSAIGHGLAITAVFCSVALGMKYIVEQS